MQRSILLIAALLLALGASAQSADSVSAASKTAYYAKSSLTGEDLWTVIAARQAAVSMATVNADGTPNAAVVIPGVTKDRSALMFGIAPNQTLENLKARKFGVLTAYLYNPTAAEKLERNKGARILLELITDQATIDRLVLENKEGGASATSIFLRVVKVMPIG